MQAQEAEMLKKTMEEEALKKATFKAKSSSSATSLNNDEDVAADQADI